MDHSWKDPKQEAQMSKSNRKCMIRQLGVDLVSAVDVCTRLDQSGDDVAVAM